MIWCALTLSICSMALLEIPVSPHSILPLLSQMLPTLAHQAFFSWQQAPSMAGPLLHREPTSSTEPLRLELSLPFFIEVP